MKKSTKRSVIWILIFIAVIAIVGYMAKPKKILSPIPASYMPIIIKEVYAESSQRELIDVYVDRYIRKYTNNNTQYSYYKQLLNCLLYYETKHGAVKKDGDNGLAGGILQFHQATWVSFRNKMLKLGLIEEVGSRYNDEQAVNTTIWALVNNYGNNWGPILRGDCK